MLKTALVERLLSLSESEKDKYLPKHKFEVLSDVQEGDFLIKNVPHTSYKASNKKSSFVPPEIEKLICDYVKLNEVNLCSSKRGRFKEVEYEEVVQKMYAHH